MACAYTLTAEHAQVTTCWLLIFPYLRHSPRLDLSINWRSECCDSMKGLKVQSYGARILETNFN